MTDYKKSPLASMTIGMSEEERKDFIESWRNATWLCDPIRKSLSAKKGQMIDQLVNSGVGTDGLDGRWITVEDHELKAEIRAIDYFLRLIP